MNFEKTRGFIDTCEELCAEGIFDLFTCVLDDAYRLTGADQMGEISVCDSELYLKALSRVIFAVNASMRENEEVINEAREAVQARLLRARDELSARDSEQVSELRQMEDGVAKLKAQVEDKEASLKALKKEREELLRRGISAADACRELRRDMEFVSGKDSELKKELSELSARSKLLISCWNSLGRGEQGGRILSQDEFKEIPQWFSEKRSGVEEGLREMSDKFLALVSYSENLTK